MSPDSPSSPAPSGSTRLPDPEAVRQRLLAAIDAAPEEQHRMRCEVAVEHLPLARAMGARFAPYPELIQDCEQVACLGLVLSVHRWDPTHGSTLMSYASPTITGELRRYLRDASWQVRPPRRLQELSAQLPRATETLRQELGRSPEEGEVADHIGVSVEEVYQARLASAAHAAISLDEPGHWDAMGWHDSSLAAVENWLTVNPLIEQLDQRSREVLVLRYLQDLTQGEIAERLDLSQGQVSRILRREIAHLRALAQPASVTA